jgi:hypothetical protein
MRLAGNLVKQLFVDFTYVFMLRIVGCVYLLSSPAPSQSVTSASHGLAWRGLSRLWVFARNKASPDSQRFTLGCAQALLQIIL